MYIWPSAGISRCSDNCDDTSRMSPIFCDSTMTRPSGTGIDCSMVRLPVEYGIEYANCTFVTPGANGPAMVTRVPAAVACGDESFKIVVWIAGSGSSKTIGCGGITGPAEALTICRMLKTDRLPSPNSMTNRD